MCATQDEAGARNIDRGKTDAGAVEPRSDQRLAGEKWRPFDQPRAHLTSMFGKTRKTAETFMSSCAIMSHVERKSKYTKLAKLPDNSANSVVKATRRILLPLASRVETITYDNGKEFASHAEIVAALGAKSYFAKPYHSWERGLNEHTNGLVRQYFPKGTDFSTLSNADVQRVENKLNSRPRKILGYQTPREVFLIAA